MDIKSILKKSIQVIKEEENSYSPEVRDGVQYPSPIRPAAVQTNQSDDNISFLDKLKLVGNNISDTWNTYGKPTLSSIGAGASLAGKNISDAYDKYSPIVLNKLSHTYDSLKDRVENGGSHSSLWNIKDYIDSNPGTATALGVGIPAALLAGAGALALRRRQLISNKKNKNHKGK